MRSRSVLLGLCALGLVVVVVSTIDIFGLFGSRPWYGWWDSNVAMTGQPFVARMVQVLPDGASAHAGFQTGDEFDLREQPSFSDRFWLLTQPPTTQTLHLIARRAGKTFGATFAASTTYQGASATKVWARVLGMLAVFWFVLCATIVAIRRADAPEARALALVMLSQVARLFQSGGMVLPLAGISLALDVVSELCIAGGMIVFVRLTTLYGVRAPWRSAFEWTAYGVCVLLVLRALLHAAGVGTLWVDPLPFTIALLPAGSFAYISNAVGELSMLPLVAVAFATVATSPQSDRPRTAWLLLPLPLAFLIAGILRGLTPFAPTWGSYTATVAVWEIIWLLGALTATYAILKRRVLDVEFVISRTVVVAAVSLIVVGAFALLEWMLGNVVVGVSHATGLLANGALALVLGLSLSPIHKRVDAIVDDVLFRKRHEDERALTAFGKEALYVTELDALLDRSISMVREHTDARDAAILLDGGGRYAAVRSFGNERVLSAGENDPAVLAMKTWHEPLDPHHYSSELEGALAVPMLGRGRLIGVLVLGERAGSEAYAPDEIAALTHFAHGIGSAVEGLQREAGTASLTDSIAGLGRKIDDLRDRLERA